jgi:prepilin-type N-terminal cleavage/methylation domain-containing protein
VRLPSAAEKGPRSAEAGFSLLELLVAFAILTIILAAVYSTFFLAHKALDGMDDSLLKLQECRMTLDTLGREMNSAFYNPANKLSGLKIEDRDLYGKQASKIVFTTFSPLTPGLSLVTYYVDDDKGKLTLMKKIHSSFAADNPEDKGADLVDDLQAFSAEALLNGKWVKTWDTAATNAVPQELRITITFMLRGKPFTLYETVIPRIGRPL